MSVALDLGATEFRSLRVGERTLKQRTLPAQYAAGRYDDSLVRALERLQRGFVRCGTDLVLVGQPAQTFSRYLETVPRSLLHPCIDPIRESLREAGLRYALRQLLPSAQPGELLVFSCAQTDVLIDCDDTDGVAAGHPLAALEPEVRALGYRPLLVSPGLGLVLAGAQATCYSAVGLSFGASGIDLSVVRQGREIGRLCVPWGGDWIDEQCRLTLAESAAEWPELETLRGWKEGAATESAHRRMDFALPYEHAYRLALDRTIGEASARFADFAGAFDDPVDLLCGGAATEWPDFLPLLVEMLDRYRFPIDIRHLRILTPPATAVLRGLLIHAELERLCDRRAA